MQFSEKTAHEQCVLRAATRGARVSDGDQLRRDWLREVLRSSLNSKVTLTWVLDTTKKKIKWSSPSKQRPEREVRKNRNQGWKDNVAARFKLACKGYSARKVHTWSPCCWEDGLQVWLMSTLGRLEAIIITQSQWFGFHESKNLKSSTKDCRKFDNSLLVTLTRVWDILSLP